MPEAAAEFRAHLAKGTTAQLPFAAVITPRNLDVTCVYVPLAPGHVRECHICTLCAVAGHRTCRAAEQAVSGTCAVWFTASRGLDCACWGEYSSKYMPGLQRGLMGCAPECRLMSGALLLLAQVSAVLAVLSAAAHGHSWNDCVQLLPAEHTGCQAGRCEDAGQAMTADKDWQLGLGGAQQKLAPQWPTGGPQKCAELLRCQGRTSVKAGQRQALLVRVRAIEVAARLAPEAAVALCCKCRRHCMAEDRSQFATKCTAAYLAC
jgi:hypothetical protein